MRLWSIHPKYLDAKGLVALWREGLLAKKVLEGRTRGYRDHPQLIRFRGQRSPIASINSYLHEVWTESEARGYSFDRSKLARNRRVPRIPVASGQLRFELEHLRVKLRVRDKERYQVIRSVKKPQAHPLFKVQRGRIEKWEKN